MPLRAFPAALMGALVSLALLSACGPKMADATARLEAARAAVLEAKEAGAPEKAPDLFAFAEDLVDQAENASRRGDYRQAVLAAELAVEKAHLALKRSGGEETAQDSVAPPK